MSETETEAVNMKSAKQNLFILDFSNSDSTSSEVIKAERDGRKADSLEVHIEAKRPGPKSSAQTPAKPSERRSGSSKNKAGSAGENSGDAISFSKKVIEALQNKVKEHNSKSSRKVTLSQLKKVFRRGAGAYSSSHRPGISRTAWGLARVNAFLRLVKGEKVKDSYKKADKDLL